MSHTFNTIPDAIAANYDRASKQTLESYHGFEIRITDTSGPNSFGYSFAVIAVPSEEKIREGEQIIGPVGSTVDVSFTQEQNRLRKLGAYMAMFPPGELDKAVAKVKAQI